MTSEAILLLYSLQVLAFGAMAIFFAERLWRNHLRHDIKPIVVALELIFSSQALISLYRLWLRADALVANRPTGLDSPLFAALVFVNVAGVVMLFVSFRRAI